MSSPRLRVALLAPFAAPSVRGNAITVERIARGLRGRDAQLDIWEVATAPARTIEAALDQAPPHVVHAFHAWRAGPLGLRLARRVEAPLVVTLTGTDANHDLFDPERAAAVRRVLEGAAAVTAFHASILDRVAAVLPDVRSRMRVVAQAAAVDGAEPFDLEARWPMPADRVLVVFPAGIRPVKAPLAPLEAFDRVVAADPRVRLLYVGPVLDEAEGERLARALAGRPWARHIGAVPHAQMPALLARADVVLNCSVSEGGMANSILEALALGRAVLASDIPGNRSLVEDGVTGLLYRDAASLEAQMRRLAADPALRARLGAAGRARVERDYPASAEIDGYLAVYRDVVPAPVA
ncbi:MAG TPA: glycosyltransferase [Candidatus Tectomicrobia bacterium]|nr:glycosyltransferase [Candidatus Tectomicrobia bacterium]